MIESPGRPCVTRVLVPSGYRTAGRLSIHAWLHQAVAMVKTCWIRSVSVMSRFDPDGSGVTRLRGDQGHKRVLKDVIRHTPALGNRFCFVERPVDSQVDAALTVLFLGLGERR